MKDKAHVLVVDDDDRLRKLLKKFLGEQGFMVTVAPDAKQARAILAWFAPDIVVLDVMMPGESGLELLAHLHQSKAAPVLMLSAMGEAEDRIKGLQIGAEDYLAKPFEPQELVLRIQTIIRRFALQKEKTQIIHFGGYVFDLGTSQLRRGDELIYLTTGEALLLKALAEQAGKPLSRETLAKCLPGTSNERSIDVQITRLRKKIEPGVKPLYLQTVRGAGYVLHTGAVA